MSSFKLDPSTRKYFCPICNQKRFVRYVDSKTEEPFGERHGRCDREIKCGYHLKPDGEILTKPLMPITQLPIYRVPVTSFQKSLTNYESNNLFKFLIRLFNRQAALELCSLYRLGTSKKWEGAVIFWQIDYKGKIGQGKIMLLDPKTGKRIKHPYIHISSVHKELGKESQKPNYRFFGEHLITLLPEKLIAIVESEKTAIIMAGINKKCNWIASGGLSMITPQRLFPFKSKQIFFYPDLGGFDKWQKKAYELNKVGYQITVSDLLEKNATEDDRQEGFDIADYFIKQRLLLKEDSQLLQNMKEKNSCLQLLIDQFQLIEIKSSNIQSYNH